MAQTIALAAEPRLDAIVLQQVGRGHDGLAIAMVR